MLEKIKDVEDLKKLNIEEKKKLAEEIRKYIIEVVSKNGGHLASNLGVVELTIALESVFNVNKDKIIWDVGHQTYTHKILNGRKESIKTLRKLNGIAGFPKTSESKADCFNTGHSSTSISAALGMARARDIKNEKYSVIAVIGDGALTGGMALEALNDVGYTGAKMTVVLNDNEMSISKSVGGMNMLLSKLRTKKFYTHSNISMKKLLLKIPAVGKPVVRFAQKVKRSVKQLIIPKMFFEEIGFTYLGPVDGHNIVELENIFKLSKQIEMPVLIHVITKKGKGYKYAEENPDKFHAIGKFEPKTGMEIKGKGETYSKVFEKTICEIARNNGKIVSITASMKDGTGLTEFAKQFPERFFDVGIAEQHALGVAAGLAKSGMIPIVPIYSSFYQRAYDQVIHDIAMQKLHVIMCVDRAGLVGNDGETHQGLLDMAFFRLIPNITIMAPKNLKELQEMLNFSVKAYGPIVIRYPRGGEEGIYSFNQTKKITYGKAEVLQEGNDVTILAIGKMVERAMWISKELKREQIDAEVINIRFLKPIDRSTIIKSLKKTKCVVTIEDGTIINGLATAIDEIILDNNLDNIKRINFAYPDKFIKQGSVNELEKIYGLNKENILREIIKIKKEHIV